VVERLTNNNPLGLTSAFRTQYGTSWTPAPTMHDVATGVSLLRRGQAGDSIRDLQSLLNAAGAQPPLELDGKFGPKTEAALKLFQGNNGVADDGRFGTSSMIAMQAHPDLQDWNPPDHPNLTGRERNRNAPRFGEKPPPGGMSAGSLQQADDAARLRRQNGAASGNGSTQLDVPFYSQFDRNHVAEAGDTACYRACRSMAAAVGVNVPPGTGNNRIEIATGQTGNGRVITDQSRTSAGRSYIDSQLAAGKPVTIGVSHKGGTSQNSDGITDHFVLVTGKGTDAQGRAYYTYNDPSTTHADKGVGNRFYVDPGTGNLIHDGANATGYVADRHTEMAMVVRNA
jgi:peptidoglycan hydrolase-like protein with peptidoglycan-binding domain